MYESDAKPAMDCEMNINLAKVLINYGLKAGTHLLVNAYQILLS